MPSGTSKYIRWTQDSSGRFGRETLHRACALRSSERGPPAQSELQARHYVHRPLTMPKVVLEEPLALTVFGSHRQRPEWALDELITYRMKVQEPRGTGQSAALRSAPEHPDQYFTEQWHLASQSGHVGTFPKYTSATWTNLSLDAGKSITPGRLALVATIMIGKTIDNATALYFHLYT